MILRSVNFKTVAEFVANWPIISDPRADSLVRIAYPIKKLKHFE